MADLFYYDAGYVDEKYFAYVADGQGLLSDYIDSGYIDVSYFADQGSFATLTCDADIISGVTVEAYGDWTSAFSQSATDYRIRPTSVSLSSEFAQSSTASRRLEGSATFSSAFTPTLTAIGFKNYTAVIDSTTSMTVDAVVNRSANVLLEHIADLNAMAAKTAAFDSALVITSTQTTTPTTLFDSTATITSSASISADVWNVQYLAATEIRSTSSIYASRYLGLGRPRNTIQNPTITSTYKKFGAGSLASQVSVPDTEPIFSGYKTKSSVVQGWILLRSTGSSFNGVSFGNLGGVIWDLTFTIGGNARYRTYNVDGSGNRYSSLTYTSSTNTTNAWYHWAVVNNGSTISYYWNGQRLGSASTTDIWTNTYGISINGDASLLHQDDFSIHRGTTLGYDPTSTSITAPSSATVNDPATTQVLYHFDSNGLDDVIVNSTGSAALSSIASITAQANGNTKSASASIASSSSLNAVAVKVIVTSANISSSSTVSAVIGKSNDISKSLSVETTLTADNQRIRGFESAEYSAFTPSMTARATKVGEITLDSQFTISIDASSYTDASADLSTAFSVTASADGIVRTASSTMSSSFTQSTVSGYKKYAQAAFTNAFTASVSVRYFEGTSLMAPMTSTLSSNPVKIARITKTLSSIVSQSSDARVNAQAPAANPQYTTYQERVDVNVSYTYTYVKSSSTRRSFYFTSDSAYWGQAGIGALEGSSLFPNSTLLTNNSASASVSMYVYEYGQSGASDWYDVYVYTYNLGVVDSVSLGSNQSVNGSGSIRLVFDVATSGLLTAYLDGSSTPISLDAPTKTFKSRIDWPSFQPFQISNQNGMFGWPPILFPTVSNIVTRSGNTNTALTSTSVSDEAYTPYYGPQEYGQADLVDYNFASLDAIGYSVVYIDASLFAGTFSQTAQAVNIKGTSVSVSSSSSVYANAGKAARANAVLTSTASLAATVDRIQAAAATITATASVTANNVRTRDLSSSQQTAFSQTAQAVKKTGIVINLSAAFTSASVGTRVRFAQTSFAAIASELVAAVKNAKGTVTLESAFTASIVARKITDRPQSLTSAFTVVAELRKIVGFEADLSLETSAICEGDRIQPAGADITAVFTETANTARSKIVGVTSNQTATATLSAGVRRFRDTIALEMSAATLRCDNAVLRLARADLSDSFDIVASPTFIVRVTAEFTAFNAVLTVGDVLNIDPYRQLKIEPETRTMFILAESRIISIEQETRVNII